MSATPRLNEYGRVTCDACQSSTLPANWSNHLLGETHRRNSTKQPGGNQPRTRAGSALLLYAQEHGYPADPLRGYVLAIEYEASRPPALILTSLTRCDFDCDACRAFDPDALSGYAIVTAVNAHDALLAALRALVEAQSPGSTYYTEDWRSATAEAEAMLKKVDE